MNEESKTKKYEYDDGLFYNPEEIFFLRHEMKDKTD